MRKAEGTLIPQHNHTSNSLSALTGRGRRARWGGGQEGKEGGGEGKEGGGKGRMKEEVILEGERQMGKRRKVQTRRIPEQR